MNDTEKQISIAATVMALTFIVVFVGVILIGTLGGEIGLMFVKIVSFTILCIIVFGGVFWALKEMFKCLLEDYVTYKEYRPSAFNAVRESLAELQASREKKKDEDNQE